MAQAEKAAEEKEDWGRCFVAGTRAVDALASLNFERGWTVDLGCGHHLTKDESKFFNIQENNGCDVIVTAENTVHHVEKEDTGVINKKQENSEDIQTGDVVAATEEINEADLETGNQSLDVKDVEVKHKSAVSETIYVNGDNFRQSIKGDIVKIEVSGQSSHISRSITGSEEILEANGETKDQLNEETDLEGSISDGDINGMIFGGSEAAKQFIEELEREYDSGSYSGAKASKENNGQIVTESCVSPDNTIVKELRERGNLETQE